MTFNHDLYVASRESLITNGVPWEIADAASAVVAKDDSDKPNLGRTPEDLEIVHKAVNHLNAFWQKEEE